MRMKICKKIDSCSKINMIMNKDMLDFQFVESVRAVCGGCKEFATGSKSIKQIDATKQ